MQHRQYCRLGEKPESTFATVDYRKRGTWLWGISFTTVHPERFVQLHKSSLPWEMVLVAVGWVCHRFNWLYSFGATISEENTD